MQPEFLTADDIVRMHAHLIDVYGGSRELRDHGLLVSAVETPRACFAGEFLHRDIYEMAAAYAFHLIGNHAFVDGNKRVGVMAALVFLSINGQFLTATADEMYDLGMRTAKGQLDKVEIAEFFRTRCVDISSQ